MKHLYVYFFSVNLVGAAVAQPTLNSGNFSLTAGSEFQISSCQVPASVGGAGANQVWDFSSLAPEQDFTAYIEDITFSELAEEFPDANLVYIAQGQQSAFSMETSGIYFHGSDVPGGSAILEPAYRQTPLPMAYGNTFDLSYTQTIDISGFINQIEVEETQTIDAYGTLTLPNGMVYNNVLRQKIESTSVISYIINGQETQAGTQEATSYVWYTPGIPNALMSVVTAEFLGQTSTSAQFLSEYSLSTSESLNLANLNIWPNPASDLVELAFDAQGNEPVQIDLMSMDGKLVAQFAETAVQGGVFRTELTTSHLESGPYLISIKHGN